ncbi:energy-coupling factor transporter transmembrane component T [Cohnella rhizosphaerae]|uniref:Energy-coupling factor transporter transmembrane protein EcfT n=1 Tax=Cohnella rhizosphaerae TaxID=1457232 RepID=A0A9X4KW28_9BACL|nr:energy-coupling factor transporter transmembrane component T [Cohnella rhizosphaerae]MDG0811538.1 energy-coupling factor transporter transmembrane protein EcfT [Cohnella rhizosphaerae]
MSAGGFAGLHPLVCFTYYAGVILLGLMLAHPYYQLASLALLTALLLLQRQGRALARSLPYYLLVGGLFAIINPLLSHRGRHILFYLMDQPITLEAVLYGAMMMMTILAVLLMFVSYRVVMTTDKFMYLFSAVLPQTALHAWMTLRFIPLFARRFRQIELVQRSRGIDMRTGGPVRRLKNGAALLRILMTWSLEDAMRTGDSMKARGYGTARRTAYYPYRMDRRDRATLAALCALLLLSLAGWREGWGLLTLFPRMEPIRLGSLEWVHFAITASFVGLPILFETKERYRWKSSRRSA